MALAGCSGLNNGGGTNTTTTTAARPSIDAFGPIPLQGPSDPRQTRVLNGIAVLNPLRVGVAFTAPVHGGEVNVRLDIAMFDAGGTELFRTELADSILVGGDIEREALVWQKTFNRHREFGRGAYQLQAIIQDRIGATASDPVRTPLALRNQLQANQVRVEDVNVLADEPISREYEVDIILRNISQHDNSVNARIEAFKQQEEHVGQFKAHLPNGETVSRRQTVQVPGEIVNTQDLQYSIPQIGAEWTVEVTGSS